MVRKYNRYYFSDVKRNWGYGGVGYSVFLYVHMLSDIINSSDVDKNGRCDGQVVFSYVSCVYAMKSLLRRV